MARIGSNVGKFGVIFAVALVGLAAGPAAAEQQCKKVHAHLFVQAEEVPTCGSPIFLCASATLQGSINATTDFIGTSAVETIDTPVSGAVVLTGDNVFHTSRGDFYTRDAIVLAADGEFAEVDTVIGGTGDFVGATGNLVGTGTFVDGVGTGVLEGEICTP